MQQTNPDLQSDFDVHARADWVAMTAANAITTIRKIMEFLTFYIFQMTIKVGPDGIDKGAIRKP